MKRRVTLKDIAKKAGVSQMTVSRVLNDRPDVKPLTRERVKSIVDEYGYIPNTNARALKGAKTNRIGVIVSDIRNPFYSELVGELEDMAGDKGLSVLVADTNKKLESEFTAIKIMDINSVDYMIIAPEGYKTDHLDRLRMRGMKFLSFGMHFPEKLYPEVWIDDYEGGKSVGKYLGNLGVKKPLLIMGNPSKSVTILRESGFIEGYESSGGSPDVIQTEHLQVSAHFSENYFFEKFQTLDFDSVFCYNDLMAMGALSAFRKLKIKPGRDLPLVGYDDVFYSRVFGLTTVHIPIKEMLEKAIEFIITGKEAKARFVPELTIRETA